MINSLTGEAGVKIGPLLLETLAKHYFNQLVSSNQDGQGKPSNKLRREELLYDEAFIIVKTFLEASTKHTVEELQSFSNTKTPTPPWVHAVRLLVPMSCCNDAAEVVIKALGGEDMTKKLVGGTKWWQVRGVKGVQAEWIVAKKDWQEHKKRYKAYQEKKTSNSAMHSQSQSKSSTTSSSSSSGSQEAEASDRAAPQYEPEMDEMRCILYAHGGGYYFGSIDQERYAIQRFARKINGRVLAINYRLAPQYPFPCALQDMLAAYLYLIRPPEGAAHRPVNPAQITVSGDSAGGGLCIAFLQVLRDCGLPMIAGGVLISPWCDLTHSFPSIHTNTDTDVIPPYGLSFYKPSTLWPAPPDELIHKVHESLRSRIRQAVSMSPRPHSPGTTAEAQAQMDHGSKSPNGEIVDVHLPQTGQTLHLGSTATVPDVNPAVRDQTVSCMTASGETLKIVEQIHLYTPNYMLDHPLVSPVVSYLGGLPPLLVLASDGEVLRDEIVYFAHRAAHPDRYPVSPEAKAMYPHLEGIEQRFGPTKVHLQVYDDTAHVLPILFSFTTPAKYCYRAIATFMRYVTGTLPKSGDSVGTIPFTTSPANTPDLSIVASPLVSREDLVPPKFPVLQEASPMRRASDATVSGRVQRRKEDVPSRISLRRAISASVSRSFFKNGNISPPPVEEMPKRAHSQVRPSQGSEDSENYHDSADVAGPRFYGSGHQSDIKIADNVRHAGEPSIYRNGLDTMIRERVSTHGVIRPLEPESELSAFAIPQEKIGVISELAMRRYHSAQAKFSKKFAGVYKTIEKHRRRNLKLAQKDALRNITRIQTFLEQGVQGSPNPGQPSSSNQTGYKEGLITNWTWAWALDVGERPPPTSIVARRDTHEAVALARIADEAVLAEENLLSGNTLWSLITNFLTVTPEKPKSSHHHHNEVENREVKTEKVRSRFAQLVADLRKHPTPENK